MKTINLTHRLNTLSNTKFSLTENIEAMANRADAILSLLAHQFLTGHGDELPQSQVQIIIESAQLELSDIKALCEKHTNELKQDQI